MTPVPTAPLRIGARGSDLALAQARWVAGRLRAAIPGAPAEIVVIKTDGDRDRTSSLAEGTTVGWFTSALSEAVGDGRVDLAVHSLKDLPLAVDPDRVLAAIPVREDPADAIALRRPEAVAAPRLLATGSRVGTGSPRRAALLAARFPGVEVAPIRGNVGTRIGRLRDGDLDAVVIAMAGLRRLGWWRETDRAQAEADPANDGIVAAVGTVTLPDGDRFPVVRLDPEQFLPAPGQGALAVEARRGSPAAAAARLIHDARAAVEVAAERAFLAAVGGGCHAAVGARAVIDGAGEIVLRGVVADTDPRAGVLTERGTDPAAVGRRLADRCAAGGDDRGRP